VAHDKANGQWERQGLMRHDELRNKHKWHKTSQRHYFKKELHVLLPKFCFFVPMNFWIIFFANYHEKCIKLFR
jgi:hypothetical protein